MYKKSEEYYARPGVYSTPFEAEIGVPSSMFSQPGIMSLSLGWLIISLGDDVAWLFAFRPDKQHFVLLICLFLKIRVQVIHAAFEVGGIVHR